MTRYRGMALAARLPAWCWECMLLVASHAGHGHVGGHL